MDLPFTRQFYDITNLQPSAKSFILAFTCVLVCRLLISKVIERKNVFLPLLTLLSFIKTQLELPLFYYTLAKIVGLYAWMCLALPTHRFITF